MILGIGIDITEVPRIRRLLERKGFAEKVFSSEERSDFGDTARPEIRLAGRFAAKEAVMKALGVGWALGVAWTDISVANDPGGKPRVTLSGRAKDIADEMGASRILVSISHGADYAVAHALIEKE